MIIEMNEVSMLLCFILGVVGVGFHGWVPHFGGSALIFSTSLPPLTML